MQLSFLAPSWVESLIQTEGRAVKQAAQIPVDLTTKGTFHVGSAAKGVATGVAAYVLANQVISMYTTGHPTWENKEEGRKFDAFVPDPLGKSEGFWLSPLSTMAEISHDIKKGAAKGEGPITIGSKLITNKLSPISRATKTLITGRDYADRKLDESGRVKQLGKDIVPVPLPLVGVASDIPGQMTKQLASTFSLKLEPKSIRERINTLPLSERIADETKLQKNKKPMENSASAVERVIFEQEERHKELLSKYNKPDRQWMESRELTIPKVADKMKIQGVNLRLRDSELASLNTHIYEETSKVIKTLRENKDFAQANSETQKSIFEANVKAAIQLAKTKVQMEIESGSQNEPNKKANKKFKVL